MSICNPQATMAPWQHPKSLNEDYPVPIQCISRRRHHQSLSWSVDEFIIAASVEPIKFVDDVDASKSAFQTNNKKSRHRRSCSASTSAPGSNKNFRTLPPLYVPYVPPSTSADRARDLPPIETPLHKKKKTTSPVLDCVVMTTHTTNHQSLLSNQTKQCRDNDEDDKSNQVVPVMQTSATVASASGSSSRLPESFSADSQTGHDTPGIQYDNSTNAFAKSLVERTVTSDSTMTIMTNPTDESRSPCTSIASFVGSGRCGPTTSTSSYSIREEEEERHNANNFSTSSGTSSRRSMTDTTRSSCRSIRFFKLLNEKAKANSITSTSSTMATSCSTTRRLSADFNTTNNNNKNNTSATGNHNPVQSLVQGVVHAVENVQEQHRKAQCRKRISQTLLTLRAATLIHYQQEQERINNNNKEKQGEDQASSVSSSSEEEKDYYHDYYDHGENYDERDNQNVDLRDLGSVLFCPLDQRLLARNNHHNHRHRRHSGKDKYKDNARENNVKNNGNSFVVEKFPVVILPEPNMSENPLLLTQEMFQQLMDEGVPECLHMHAWQRIFSIGRDGDSFLTLLDHCAPYQHTILVVQTTTGHLFGGFVSDPWQEQEGYSLKHSYYGTGMSFLFANHPYYPPGSDAQDDNKDSSSSAKKKTSPLTIFPWTGSNDFCQICDMDKNILAMGGSGAFGFILEDDFYKGSTDHCGTFGNPPLTPDKDGIFTVAAMEIYGLVPFGLLGPNHVCSHSVVDPKLNPQSLIVHNAELGGFY